MDQHDDDEIDTFVFVEPDDDAPPAPPVPVEPRKGVYVLVEGDTPGIVSVKLYGRGQFAVDLVRANPNVEWDAGSTITIP